MFIFHFSEGFVHFETQKIPIMTWLTSEVITIEQELCLNFWFAAPGSDVVDDSYLAVKRLVFIYERIVMWNS